MAQVASQDYTHLLQNLMQRVGISSFKALVLSSGVSERQLMRLRRGEIQQMRVDVLLKLCRALQVTLTELVATFSEVELVGENVTPPQEPKLAFAHTSHANATLRQEYQRLQVQLEQQRQELWQEFQQSSLQVLESWLLQWPTAARVAQENPDLIERMVDEGHQIVNHTWSHPSFTGFSASPALTTGRAASLTAVHSASVNGNASTLRSPPPPNIQLSSGGSC